jgi:predicted GNAT family acetyltransferase
MNGSAGMSGGLGPVTIRRHDAIGRYELLVGDRLAAYVEVLRAADAVEMPHTYTWPEFRGRGLAAKLVQAALDDLALESARLVASCWFVAEFVDAHPEYRSLLAR